CGIKSVDPHFIPQFVGDGIEQSCTYPHWIGQAEARVWYGVYWLFCTYPDCIGLVRTGCLGGEGGIRTPGTLASTPHFECGAIDHSATSPEAVAPNGEVRLVAFVFGRRK